MNLTLSPLTSDAFNPDPEALKSQKKLEEAAKGFESLMIAQMMKSARETSSGGWLSDGDESGEDSSMGMAEQQFAQSMAANGGLGLAKMVVKTMARATATAQPPIAEAIAK